MTQIITPADTPEMTVEADVVVTPALARKWVALNFENNRNKRPARIKRWARDHANARWRKTGEAIKFRTDGKLVDGQNRLIALSDAEEVTPEKPFVCRYCTRPELHSHFTVIRNVEPGAVKVMDSGGSRTTGDALKIDGAPQRFVNAAVVGWILKWDHGNRMGQGGMSFTPSHSEIIEAYDRDMHRFDSAARRGSDVKGASLGNGTAFGVAHALFSQTAYIDNRNVEDFFSAFLSGLGFVHEYDPIRLLRERMIRRRADRLTTAEELALAIRGWNHWRNEALTGERSKVKKLMVSREELSNANFPTPK